MTMISILDPSTGQTRQISTRLEDPFGSPEPPTSSASSAAKTMPARSRRAAKGSRPRRWDLLVTGSLFLGAVAAVAYPVYGRSRPAAAVPGPIARAPAVAPVATKPEIKIERAAASDLPAPSLDAKSAAETAQPAGKRFEHLDEDGGTKVAVASAPWMPLHPDWSAPVDAQPVVSAERSGPSRDLIRHAVVDDKDLRAPASLPRRSEPYVGVWSTHARACLSPTSRRELLAAIDNRGAWAGETRCDFRNKRETGRGWSFDAQCSSARERWRSTVRLKVEGSKLTWSSQRGSQAYVRCERRMLTAQAPML